MMLTEAFIAETLFRLGWKGADEALSSALAKFQGFYGLDQSGEVDKLTERAIAERVFYGCGNADNEQSGKVCKWNSKEISYHVARTPSGLNEVEAKACYRRAWESWEKVCGIRVTEVPNPERANVLMDVGRGRRADFDGPSGVLAWSQMPCGGQTQLLQRYDLDETFGVTPARGVILLENVACHEIGHALGISHIAPSLGQALMNPTYSARIAKPLALDIEEATKRYGKGASLPPTDPAPKQVTIVIQDPGVITINGRPFVG